MVQGSSRYGGHLLVGHVLVVLLAVLHHLRLGVLSLVDDRLHHTHLVQLAERLLLELVRILLQEDLSFVLATTEQGGILI